MKTKTLKNVRTFFFIFLIYCYCQFFKTLNRTSFLILFPGVEDTTKHLSDKTRAQPSCSLSNPKTPISPTRNSHYRFFSKMSKKIQQFLMRKESRCFRLLNLLEKTCFNLKAFTFGRKVVVSKKLENLLTPQYHYSSCTCEYHREIEIILKKLYHLHNGSR